MAPDVPMLEMAGYTPRIVDDDPYWYVPTRDVSLYQLTRVDIWTSATDFLMARMWGEIHRPIPDALHDVAAMVVALLRTLRNCVNSRSLPGASEIWKDTHKGRLTLRDGERREGVTSGVERQGLCYAVQHRLVFRTPLRLVAAALPARRGESHHVRPQQVR